jgi:hypothetical protein
MSQANVGIILAIIFFPGIPGHFSWETGIAKRLGFPGKRKREIPGDKAYPGRLGEWVTIWQFHARSSELENCLMGLKSCRAFPILLLFCCRSRTKKVGRKNFLEKGPL